MKAGTVTLSNGVEMLDNIVYKAISASRVKAGEVKKLEQKRGEVVIARIRTSKRSIEY